MKSTEEVMAKARELVTLCNSPSTNAVKNYSMSSTWYSTTATKDQLKKLASAIRSVYRKVGKDDLLLTLPKENADKNSKRTVVHPNINIEDVFLYCGARATNDYADKSVALHAYNRYVNLVVKSYLQDYGLELDAVPDDDQFALSEMIQWIWRTRIRKDEPVELYILPKRMEKLFKDWLYSDT